MGCGKSTDHIEPGSRGRIPTVSAIKISASSFLIRSKGTLPSDYVELRSLGSGSFAEVVLCDYKPLNQKRAVKIIHKAGLHYQQMDSQYMLKEISVLTQLDHPHILRCYEIIEDNTKFYVSTEYCKGGELFERIQKLKKFSEKEASEIMHQLLSAVGYCHSKGVIHRDLKPENILLEDKEDTLHIKVADFGSSIITDPNRRLTGCFGSAYYLAPEVLSGDYNEKCDVWSCGVILYIMLTGKPPYPGRTDKEIVFNVRRSPLAIKEQESRFLSASVVDLLRKLLIVSPAERISAFDALAHPWVQIFRTPADYDSLHMSLEHLSGFSSSSKLKDAVYTFLATHVVSAHEIQALRASFEAIDTNGDGKLSREELLQQFRATMNSDEAQIAVDGILKELDKNQSGEIDYSEFLGACMSTNNVKSKANLSQAFKMFDQDGSGSITVNEIKALLGDKNHIEESVWRDLVSEVDQNGDGVIDLKEFINIMTK
jgi:calcium-dependent protein kinase